MMYKFTTQKILNLLPEKIRSDNFASYMFPWIQNWLDSHGNIDDLPDGAYWAMHAEATDEFVKVYNSKKSKNPRRHKKIDIDWYDIQDAFIEWQNKNTSHLKDKKPLPDGFGFTWQRNLIGPRSVGYGIYCCDNNKTMHFQIGEFDVSNTRILIAHKIKQMRQRLRESVAHSNNEVNHVK